MKTNTNDTTLQIKLKDSEKAQIKEMADNSNLSMTDLIKTTLFSEKVIFLDKGGSIAAALTGIQIELQKALRGKELTSELEVKLLNVLEVVLDKFSLITEQLTDIHPDDENDESEGM